ncbi:MAG: penicillin-binding transpeptidase domain-containing protein, partial [Egibacteraceae bacterium]
AQDAPGSFMAVTTLPRSRYEAVSDRLAPVPGVFFEARQRRRSAAASLSSQILGEVGELPAKRLRELGDHYVKGDVGGLSGLEAAYERQLSGAPGGDIRVVGDRGRVVEVLRRYQPSKPGSIRTTLQRRAQRAAQRALSGIADPAAMVVMDARNGQVLAVANEPVGGFDRALLGAYPPGSTFKVLTTTALLRSGVVQPSTGVTCPREATVGGLTFGNAGGEVLGDIPFRTAFFRSCNTAFVQLADELDTVDLVDTVESLGFNDDSDDYAGGVPVQGGSFPVPEDAAEQAAAAIGQGRVLATPLQMASVAAAMAGGTWHPPSFVVADDPDGTEVPEAPTLRRLMRLVVKQGTGTAAAVGNQPIGGKTGTAEFGSEDPPDTHAWFIGFRGDAALAVVVEGGGFGGEVAAPAAARFFRSYDA